jgi:PhoPQ-activated pathogenicity-related protein
LRWRHLKSPVRGSLWPFYRLCDEPRQQIRFAFLVAKVTTVAYPQFSWKVQDDGTIRVQTKDKPREVNLWQATNPKARDFRLVSIGKAYEKSTLESQGDGIYVAKVKQPKDGWTAFFVELVYDSGGKVP